MEPDILGALSSTMDGKEWDLPAIPLTRRDMDLSSFAVDGGIIDPDLDALGFYRNGQLDMDQVNHHVRLALDCLHCYDNKGNCNRHINDSAGKSGPSCNGRRAPAFNPFKVAMKRSTTTITPMAPVHPNPPIIPAATTTTPPPVAVNTPAAASTSTQARKTPVAHHKDKKKADEDTHMDDNTNFKSHPCSMPGGHM